MLASLQPTPRVTPADKLSGTHSSTFGAEDVGSAKKKGKKSQKKSRRQPKRNAGGAAAEKSCWTTTLSSAMLSASSSSSLLGAQPSFFVDKDDNTQPYCRFYKDEGGKNKNHWVFDICPAPGEHTFHVGAFLRCINPHCKSDPREGGTLVSKSACHLVRCTAPPGVSVPYFVNNPENKGWKSYGFTICAAESEHISFSVHCEFCTVNSGMRCLNCNWETRYQFLVESNRQRVALTRAVEVRSKRKIPHYMRKLSAREIAQYHQQQKKSVNSVAVAHKRRRLADAADQPTDTSRVITLEGLCDSQARFETEVRAQLEAKAKRIQFLENCVQQLHIALHNNTMRHNAISASIERLQSIVLKRSTNNSTIDPCALSEEAQVELAFLSETTHPTHSAAADWILPDCPRMDENGDENGWELLSPDPMYLLSDLSSDPVLK